MNSFIHTNTYGKQKLKQLLHNNINSIEYYMKSKIEKLIAAEPASMEYYEIEN